jgi:hypothetical protein
MQRSAVRWRGAATYAVRRWPADCEAMGPKASPSLSLAVSSHVRVGMMFDKMFLWANNIDCLCKK